MTRAALPLDPNAPQHRLTWGAVSVVVSGIDAGIARDLAHCLALDPPVQAQETQCDVTVQPTAQGARVSYGPQRHDVPNATDLMLLLATLVPASLMEKAGVGRRMHCAGIRIGDALLLISGEGHMGKSSISLAAWRRGFEVLGDDWLLFSEDFTGMTPIPKPLKARMSAAQFATMTAGGDGLTSATFGGLLGETRALIPRSNGFYNAWDTPMPVGALIFLDRPAGRGLEMEQLNISETLPLILSQTILCENSMNLSGIAFARTLSRREKPVFRLCLGQSTPDGALDAILTATEPWLHASRIMPLSKRF